MNGATLDRALALYAASELASPIKPDTAKLIKGIRSYLERVTPRRTKLVLVPPEDHVLVEGFSRAIHHPVHFADENQTHMLLSTDWVTFDRELTAFVERLEKNQTGQVSSPEELASLRAFLLEFYGGARMDSERSSAARRERRIPGGGFRSHG